MVEYALVAASETTPKLLGEHLLRPARAIGQAVDPRSVRDMHRRRVLAVQAAREWPEGSPVRETSAST
ncbi:hypothetical protein CH253_19055 [Rhodococcus sp. 06-156-3C]|nr:hypothetical protein CH248_28585 [Rhodococcus sp. 06-156-4a]OZD18021.1 hypothetical protein CH253_19055 [Rhodococcus sp. 06-156-3C]OZD20419.1 hypothetical protein CH280_04540 [Rhodococcus sp. 06-156-4C]OZD29263.1 hypothetical protein CH284_27395 [Rhodococcus sp. 06-156-3]OZD30535.1 hypothetical protein CH247_14520 [Rhodococcus sp. 06-156-3b]OZF64897.1 hypothetical protein CH290_09845 [Rhodococcus sp. 06-156-4]